MKNFFIKDISFGQVKSLFCWVSNIRKHNNYIFLDLYDSTGEIQGVVPFESNAFKNASFLKKESAIELSGDYIDNELIIDSLSIVALAQIDLSPSPNQSNFNIFDKRFSRQVIEHPTFYIRNNKLKNIYLLKSHFKREIQQFFNDKGFVEFESPTLTRQTLYNDSGAIWLDAKHPNISLSRCATFHLEPAILAYEKVFTITNSHADEKVKTNRHLIEYLHLKAEICWTNLEELIEFAGNFYYQVSLNLLNNNRELILKIIDERTISKKLFQLNPTNHKIITYDDACDLLNKEGITIEYGKSLTTRHEKYLTEYFGDVFVWVKYIPYTVEGFMFKRLESNNFLTKTCDLIAPNGFGEILGCAEKFDDYDSLIDSMKEKGKFEDFERYKDYALLHKYGLPPHGGIGMGIERALRFLLDVDHVKFVKPFAVVKTSQINH